MSDKAIDTLFLEERRYPPPEDFAAQANALRPEDVVRRGITGVDWAQVEAAISDGARVKQLVTLELPGAGGANDVVARVEPAVLLRDDPLASIPGVLNAIVCRAEPVGEVMVTGPGAGLELAGQGVFSDLIAVALSRPA